MRSEPQAAGVSGFRESRLHGLRLQDLGFRGLGIQGLGI